MTRICRVSINLRNPGLIRYRIQISLGGPVPMYACYWAHCWSTNTFTSKVSKHGNWGSPYKSVSPTFNLSWSRDHKPHIIDGFKVRFLGMILRSCGNISKAQSYKTLYFEDVISVPLVKTEPLIKQDYIHRTTNYIHSTICDNKT